MTRPSADLIRALRETASRLERSTIYQWGHMGQCNCGHLAQTITGLSPAEIHAFALAREGDWEQQARDYCPDSGLLIDHVLASLMEIGLDAQDIRNLERLSDPSVVRRLGFYPRHNRRDDVVSYLRAWAEFLSQGQIDQGRATGGQRHGSRTRNAVCPRARARSRALRASDRAPGASYCDADFLEVLHCSGPRV